MDSTVTCVYRTSWKRINKDALSILEEYNPDALFKGAPVDIERIFDLDLPDIMQSEFGISLKTGVIDLSTFPNNGRLLGLTHAGLGVSYVDESVYDTEDIVQLRRGRATMAHETFHCIRHVPRLQTFISGTDLGAEALPRALRSELRPFEDPELQAWKFAQMIMMPEPIIKKFMREGKNERWMADYFDVNPAFLRVRLGCKTLR